MSKENKKIVFELDGVLVNTSDSKTSLKMTNILKNFKQKGYSIIRTSNRTNSEILKLIEQISINDFVDVIVRNDSIMLDYIKIDHTMINGLSVLADFE